MKFLPILIGSLFLLFNQLAFAGEEIFFNSPLDPNTSVIAGDLSKNEFYIVAENEMPKVLADNTPVVANTPAPKPQAPVKLAKAKSIGKTAKATPQKLVAEKYDKKTLQQLRDSISKVIEKAAAEKKSTPKRYAFYNKPHKRSDHQKLEKIANKTKVRPIVQAFWA